MVKKFQKTADKNTGAAGLLDGPLATSVKESAQQIWLAGMGAFSKAQEEGGKVFEALVKEGMTLQRKTQSVAEEKMGEVTGRMSSMADSVTNRAGQNWDKLEGIFEARTAKAMNKLGVPTARDVQALMKRVDELALAVARLSKAPKSDAPAGAKTPARRAPARKTPAKTAAPVAAKAAAKKAAAKKAATKRAARKAAA